MTPDVSRVAIAGAGGMGREALSWLRDARPELEAVAFFVAHTGERPAGVDADLPVMTSVEELVAAGVEGAVLGIGDGFLRRKVADEVEKAGLSLVTVVHPSAFLGPGVVVQRGAILAPGSLVTRDVQIGKCSIVNFGAKIGHDCVVKDFAFVGPGAVLAGNTVIEDGAFVGANSTILPGVRIQRGACVGAGAVVVESVDAAHTVVGNPGKYIDRSEILKINYSLLEE